MTLNGTGTAKGLTNAAGATITLANNTISVTSATGAITNAGSITMSGGTLSDLNAGIGNSGTITSSSGTSFLASGATGTNNSGTLSVTAGTLQVTGTGGLTNAAAGLVSIASLSTLQIAGALINNGQLTVNGGTLQENGAGIANAGTITTAGTSTIAASAGTNVTGTLAVNNGDLTVTGVLTDAAGGHITLGSSATLTDANGITMSGGTINGFGTLGANTNIIGFGTVAISISNAGTITASGSTLDLTGTVSGRTLAINTTAGSDLKIDGTVTTSAAIAISDPNQTLEVGALGNLTTIAENITKGTVQLDGGTLGGGALTIGSGANLTGSGTVNNAINGTGGTITANGVLNLTSTVASGQSFAIGTASASTLLFSGTATASNPISITDSHQTLEIGALGSLTINSAETITNGTVKLDGGTLTDTGGLTVGSGGTLTGFGTAPNDITLAGGTVSQSAGGTLNTVFITGFGTVNGVTGTTSPVTGATQIVASGGGTLDLIGTVSGSQLAVDATKPLVANVLKVDGNVTAGGIGSIQFTNANQTVEIGATGILTLPSSETMNNGTIKFDGGTLNATGGLIGTRNTVLGVVGSGVTLIGKGVVNGAISGGGVVEGQGGVLTVSNNVTSSTILLEADSAPSSVLALDGTVASGISFDYLNTGGVLSGGLLLGNTTARTSFENSGTIVGMNVGSSATATTDFIDIAGVVPGGFTKGIIAGSTIELFNGTTLVDHFNLASAPGANAFVDWQTDGSGGTDVFLSTVTCFVAGTRVLTVTGERTVESLMQGDIVLTLADGDLVAQPVRWVGQRRIDLTAHPRPATVGPVRIRRGAFAENMPHADLLVSPDHAVFVDGKLICARQLINGTTICAEKGWTAVEYFHVELDTHAILFAEGLPAESYLDTGNRGFFANSGEPLATASQFDRRDGLSDPRGGIVCSVCDGRGQRAAGVAAPGRACGRPGPADAEARHDERSGAAHRGQGPDGATAVWRERALHLRPAEGYDRGARGFACGRTDGRKTVAGRSPLPRGERGAHRAARRERTARGSGRSSGPVAGLACGRAGRRGAAPVDHRRCGAAAAGAG